MSIKTKIIPKIIDEMNYMHENRHKLKTQQIIFGEDSIYSIVTNEAAEYLNNAEERVQLIDCDTSNMLNDTNETKRCGIMITIEKPSQDNKGHLIYILDSSGGCGSHTANNYEENTISVVYYDEENVRREVGVIKYEKETLTIFSDGTSWKLYENLLYIRIGGLEGDSRYQQAQIDDIKTATNAFASQTIIYNKRASDDANSNVKKSNYEVHSSNLSSIIASNSHASFNCTWSCLLGNSNINKNAKGQLYLQMEGSPDKIIGEYDYFINPTDTHVSFSSSFSYHFSTEESNASSINVYMKVDNNNGAVKTDSNDHFNCNMQTIVPIA